MMDHEVRSEYPRLCFACYSPSYGPKVISPPLLLWFGRCSGSAAVPELANSFSTLPELFQRLSAHKSWSFTFLLPVVASTSSEILTFCLLKSSIVLEPLPPCISRV